MSTFVALGSNLGDRLAHLQGAVDALRTLGHVRAVSPVYDTPPMYLLVQPHFLNALVELHTELDPDVLMAELLGIERSFGRRRGVPAGPRTLDLDLIDHNGLIVDSPELVLPHPRLGERPFVVFPLRDLAPAWRHPVTDVPVTALANALQAPDRSAGTLQLPSGSP